MVLRGKVLTSGLSGRYCNVERPEILSQNAILTFVSRREALGAISFTYGISESQGPHTSHTFWCPRAGFQAKTYERLLHEVPGAYSASGLRIVFSGAGIRVEGCVVDDVGLVSLKAEFNDQLDRALIEQGVDIIYRGITLHIQIFIIREVPLSNVWIFL